MTQLLPPAGANDGRQKRLLVLAWAATLVPLIMFGFLTARLVQVKREVGQIEAKKAQLLDEIGGLEKKLAYTTQDLAGERESAKHYREFAGIKIQFYRDEDRARVEAALEAKGFQVEARKGSSPLIPGKANAIAYGSLVASQDLRDIAIALVEADFPLKRIAPATKQPDPNLIQIYASAKAEESCGCSRSSRSAPGRSADRGERRRGAQARGSTSPSCTIVATRTPSRVQTVRCVSARPSRHASLCVSKSHQSVHGCGAWIQSAWSRLV